MTEKKCSKCKRYFAYELFYFTKGRYRSECKKCTIKANILQQKKAKRKNIPPDKAYMREYYANNKEKFAEYRRRFNEKHPGYFRLYKQKILNK